MTTNGTTLTGYYIRHHTKEWGLFIILGILVANMWANDLLGWTGLGAENYHHFQHLVLWQNNLVGHHMEGVKVVTVDFLASEVLFTLFLTLAMVHIKHALTHGELSNRRNLLFVGLATLGGVIGPIAVHQGWMIAQPELTAILGDAWAVGTATDIAVSYLFAKIGFGGQKAKAALFLLALAILDDKVGIVIIALFFPQGEMRLQYLGIAVVASIITYMFKKRRIDHWALHLLPMAISWWAFYQAGVHPVVSGIGVVPFMSHAAEHSFERFMHWGSEVILGLFTLVKTGVTISPESVNAVTIVIGSSLFFGKFLGVTIGSIPAILAKELKLTDVIAMSLFAAIGLSVSVLLASISIPAEHLQSAIMGILFASLAAGVLGIFAAKYGQVEE